jgi:hypothetical protein
MVFCALLAQPSFTVIDTLRTHLGSRFPAGLAGNDWHLFFSYPLSLASIIKNEI